MCKRNILAIVAVAILALAIGQVQAETVTIDINGEFLMYKPGTGYTVLATFPPGGNSYAQGVGDNLTVIGDGIANYSDGTSGAVVDCPGWKVLTGNDDLFGNGMDGSVGFNAFGTWSGGTGTTAESADSLGDIAGGSTYTLSAMVNGSAGPLVLDLLAGGVPLTPSSSVTPSSPTDGWQEISRTYDAGAVGNYVGQAMTIVLGTGAENLVGTRVVFDNVSLSYELLFQASNPIPEDEATDVLRDVVLSWTPGEYAPAVNGHIVYLSEIFTDVNDGIGGITQSDDSYAPAQRLDFDKTYYWRVDEVNAPPDSTVHEGRVWSFTTEPIGYPIDAANITATASSASPGAFGPEKTIDGSGLDENDLHSVEATDMWLSGEEPQGVWIQYELDKVYKLHEMWVWNSNQMFEAIFGFGLRDVAVEYSTDGVEWTALADVPEFAQASGTSDYAHSTTVEFGGAVAKYVKLTANSNWGGIVNQYSLSEVRFFHIPVNAREPSPNSGATDVDVNVTLGWRSGREAATHNVYLGTDEQAVIDGTVAPVSLTDAIYSSAFDLDSTYFWRIDEVNDAETPATWQGDVWDFTTQQFIVVEDFEPYNDIPAGEEGSNPVYLTWLDGFDNPSANGSTIGYTEMYQPSMETSIVYGDGKQSVPLFYNNTVAGYSEVSVNTDALAIGRDWTTGSPTTMTLRFYGDPNNAVTEQLYVKIGGIRADYPGDPAELAQPGWSEWPIDLAGIDLSNVPTLAVGFERTGATGGSGVVFLDDIRLYRSGISDVSAIPITVPNGDFEEIYKPGSDTITADLSDGWTQGLGPDTPMDSGVATYSDGTTGDAVDIPGWIGADPQGWIDGGGTYDRDTSFPNRQGSVARQSDTPDGLYYYLSNGGGWGNAAGGLIVSDASLGNVEDGTYTLSMLANGGATPVVLELLADGVALTPSSSVDLALSGEWQEFSRTYDAVSLGGHLGESLTIRLGVGRGASGGQSHFDAVSLSHVP
ncbi:MAG: discoidin domain-containing protein [Planctomycetota bacterium]|jgi:hypothetical protein